MDNFSEHNAEVRTVWAEYAAGHPSRVPVCLSWNPRMWLLDARQNTERIPFEQYYADPDVMLGVQLRCRAWMPQNLWNDVPMGLPDAWDVYPDFQNDFECGQLGARVRFSSNAVPFTEPFLTDENKYAFLDRGIPAPYAGLSGRAWDYYEHFQILKKNGFEYLGRPLGNIGAPGMYTDGPMTLACMVRGATEFCVDLYEEPEFADALLGFLAETAIARIRALRARLDLPARNDSYSFADDSIALLSPADYRERILPHHKRLVRELAVCGEDGRSLSPTSIHLCGDATRHFATIVDELNCRAFDTGFPVNHGQLVRALGPDVQIAGGPTVDLLLRGTPESVAAETRRILSDVMPYTKRFLLKEANNLAPGTPFENVRAMYETARSMPY